MMKAQHEILRFLASNDLERVGRFCVELSPREAETLELMLDGKAVREIASLLKLNKNTVRTYRAKILTTAKLYVKSESFAENTSKLAPKDKNILAYHTKAMPRPPINAEYVLYLVLRKEEREVVIGDLVECYHNMVWRFDKRRADVWFYKQVFGSLMPLLRRALLKIGALVWLGRILRRLIS
jgi:hypothetical protein